VKNVVGVLRFMDKSLFAFNKEGTIYVCLAEVYFRGLLPLSDMEKTVLMKGWSLPFIKSEVSC
jgi:hypothetical protein